MPFQSSYSVDSNPQVSNLQSRTTRISFPLPDKQLIDNNNHLNRDGVRKKNNNRTKLNQTKGQAKSLETKDVKLKGINKGHLGDIQKQQTRSLDVCKSVSFNDQSSDIDAYKDVSKCIDISKTASAFINTRNGQRPKKPPEIEIFSDDSPEDEQEQEQIPTKSKLAAKISSSLKSPLQLKQFRPPDLSDLRSGNSLEVNEGQKCRKSPLSELTGLWSTEVSQSGQLGKRPPDLENIRGQAKSLETGPSSASVLDVWRSKAEAKRSRSLNTAASVENTSQQPCKSTPIVIGSNLEVEGGDVNNCEPNPSDSNASTTEQTRKNRGVLASFKVSVTKNFDI